MSARPPRANLPDPLTPEQRRYNMSRVRSANTKPELLVRRGLHALGWRFRLHDRRLPGTPDLVFASRRALIWVHGCFWHGHDCPLFRLPATRTEFWESKIAANRARDDAARDAAHAGGWRTLIIWECALRSRGRLQLDEVLARSARWLDGDLSCAEIAGEWPQASTSASA